MGRKVEGENEDNATLATEEDFDWSDFEVDESESAKPEDFADAAIDDDEESEESEESEDEEKSEDDEESEDDGKAAKPKKAKAKAKEKKGAKDKEDKGDDGDDSEEGEEGSGEDSDGGDGEKWRFKVLDEEIEVDPKDTVKLKQLVQKGLGSDKKFQEAAIERKKAQAQIHQAQSLLRTLKEKPEDILRHPDLGIDLKDLAERILIEEYESERNPEKKRLRELERIEERRRQRDEALAREQQRQQQEEAHRQAVEKLKEHVSEALKEANLPENDWTERRTLHHIKNARSQGFQLTAREVMEYVAKDWAEAKREWLRSIPKEKLIDELGEDVADDIRRANLERRKPKKQIQGERQKEKTRTAKKPKTQQYIRSAEEIEERLLRRLS